MLPMMARQRFCCRACSDQFFHEERKQAVAHFRAEGLRPVIERKEAAASQ